MDSQNIGYGAAGLFGSIFGALLSFFGIRDRIVKLEKSVLYKDTCDVCKKSGDDIHKELKERLQCIDEKLAESNKSLNQLIGALKKGGD